MGNASVFVRAHEEILNNLIIGEPSTNFFTPSRIINLATGETIVQSYMNWFAAVDVFSDVGFPGLLYPIKVVYDWINSYAIPREAIPSYVDYGMPPYEGNERRFLDPTEDKVAKYWMKRYKKLEKKYIRSENKNLKRAEKGLKYTKKYASEENKELEKLAKKLKKYETSRWC